MLTTRVSGQCAICGDNGFVVGNPDAVVFGANGDICQQIVGPDVPPQICIFLTGFIDTSTATCGVLDDRGDEIPAQLCPLIRASTLDICGCTVSNSFGSFFLADIIAAIVAFLQSRGFI